MRFGSPFSLTLSFPLLVQANVRQYYEQFLDEQGQSNMDARAAGPGARTPLPPFVLPGGGALPPLGGFPPHLLRPGMPLPGFNPLARPPMGMPGQPWPGKSWGLQ